METTEKEKTYSRKYVRLLLFVCWFAYTAANIGRMNYSASMVTIIEQTGSTKNAAGLVASFFFFSYGIGQLVNGIFCHKYNERFMVFGALVLSAAANIGLSLCRTVEPMKYLWLINGCVQSVLWSSIIKLQSAHLQNTDINKSILVMSTTTAVGTFTAYGLSALFVMLGNWRPTFWVASVILAAAAFIWFFSIGAVKKNLPRVTDGMQKKESSETLPVRKNGFSKPLYISLAIVFIFAIANGFIKDGITTWVPNLLYETHNIEDYFSILLTLILPLFSITGAYIFKAARKKLPNDVLLCGLFYLTGGITSALVLWLYSRSLGATVALFAVIQCCMSAVNNIVTSSIPFRLRTLGDSGRFAGIINMFSYMGSTLSSFLLGYLADAKGWNAVMILFVCASAAVGIIAAAFSVYWKKKIRPLIDF